MDAERNDADAAYFLSPALPPASVGHGGHCGGWQQLRY